METRQAESGFDITRLKAYRAKAGLTQAELSKRSGISAFTITHIETGNAGKLHRATAEKLEAALSACFREGLPPAKPTAGRPPESRRIICPHCGAASYTMSETPGVEYKCVSCARDFRVDANGRGYIPVPPRTPKTHNSWHRDGEGERA